MFLDLYKCAPLYHTQNELFKKVVEYLYCRTLSNAVFLLSLSLSLYIYILSYFSFFSTMPYTTLQNGSRPSHTWTSTGHARTREDQDRLFRRWKDAAAMYSVARTPVPRSQQIPAYTPSYIPHDWIAQYPAAAEAVESVRSSPAATYGGDEYPSSASLLSLADASARFWTSLGIICLLVWFLWLADSSARPLDYVVSVAIIGATVFFGGKTLNIETVLKQDIVPAVKNASGNVPVVHVIPPVRSEFIPHSPRGTIRMRNIL